MKKILKFYLIHIFIIHSLKKIRAKCFVNILYSKLSPCVLVIDAAKKQRLEINERVISPNRMVDSFLPPLACTIVQLKRVGIEKKNRDRILLLEHFLSVST